MTLSCGTPLGHSSTPAADLDAAIDGGPASSTPRCEVERRRHALPKPFSTPGQNSTIHAVAGQPRQIALGWSVEDVWKCVPT